MITASNSSVERRVVNGRNAMASVHEYLLLYIQILPYKVMELRSFLTKCQISIFSTMDSYMASSCCLLQG